MRDIKIFSAEEKIPGLVDKITSKAARTIAYCSQLSRQELPKLEEIPEVFNRVKSIATNLNQPDLYYFSSVLVTTGLNKNDDFFAPEEVWAAKSTPEDKPINDEHREKDIWGHITACYPIDDSYKIIPSNLSIDTLPSKFHIVTGGVLYTNWEDEALEKRIAKIIAEIENGEMYVSMEALFSDFDYVLYESTGSYSVVNRMSDTAFLTKALRCYGGSGVYKDKKIGRVLRHITFSGKGLVKNPANPESIIFNETLNLDKKIKSSLVIGEHKTMAETQELNMTKVASTPLFDANLVDELKSVKAALETEKSARLEAKAQADAEAKARAAQEVADLKSSVASKTGELTVAQERIQKLEADLKAASDKATAAEAEIKTANEKLAKVEAEAKTSSRVAALETAGHSKEKALELVTELADLNDTAFAKTVALIKVEAAKTEDEDEDDEDKKGKASAAELLKGADKTKDTLPGGGQGKTKAEEIFAALTAKVSERLKATAKTRKAQK